LPLDSKPSRALQSYTLGYAIRGFTARHLPVDVAVPHFPCRDAICVYDGPSARITFADKNHAGFRLQRGVQPRHSVCCASSDFDLNDLRHASPAVLMVAGNVSIHRDTGHI